MGRDEQHEAMFLSQCGNKRQIPRLYRMVRGRLLQLPRRLSFGSYRESQWSYARRAIELRKRMERREWKWEHRVWWRVRYVYDYDLMRGDERM